MCTYALTCGVALPDGCQLLLYALPPSCYPRFPTVYVECLLLVLGATLFVQACAALLRLYSTAPAAEEQGSHYMAYLCEANCTSTSPIAFVTFYYRLEWLSPPWHVHVLYSRTLSRDFQVATGVCDLYENLKRSELSAVIAFNSS